LDGITKWSADLTLLTVSDCARNLGFIQQYNSFVSPISAGPPFTFEIKNFNPTRRIKLGESKPGTWPTNVGIIRNLSKKGTTDGGKGV
jgi:hypothetical protein